MSVEYRRPPVTFGIALRSTLFSIGQILSTLLFAPFVVLSVLVPYRFRYAFVVRWTYFNVWWLRHTCKLSHEVEGLEDLLLLELRGPAHQALFLQQQIGRGRRRSAGARKDHRKAGHEIHRRRNVPQNLLAQP